MSVTNGQVANASTFNNAFVSKTAEGQNVDGTINLVNEDSGSDVTNLQQTINDIHSTNSSQDGDIATIQADLAAAVSTSVGDTDASKLVRLGEDGRVEGTILQNLGPKLADDVAASAYYGDTLLGGEVYYNESFAGYLEYDATLEAWKPMSANTSATGIDEATGGSVDAGKLIKTNADGNLDSSFNTTIPSFVDDVAFETFLDRTPQTGDRYFNSTSNVARMYYSGAWHDSGGGSSTQTYYGPTYQSFTSGSGTYNLSYRFIISSGSATAGATYTNNSVTFTVKETVSSGTMLWATGSGDPSTSGTLTKASGTGDSTLTFSAFKKPIYLHVVAVGAGGGGAGSGTNSSSGGTGGAGGNTTFGSSLVTANGGSGGAVQQPGGNGGTASIGTGATGLALSGAKGSSSTASFNSTVNSAGGNGANSAFGGGGAGGYANQAAAAGVTNTGGGGGGAGGQTSNTVQAGSGGGAGGYVNALISSPSGSYSYAVGAAGTAGTAGTNGIAGGAGGSGVITVTEHYQ